MRKMFGAAGAARTALAIAAVAALGAAAGATGALAQEKITFLTNWKAQAEHGGFYQAIAKGFYKKHGIEVTLRPGGPGINNRQLIAAGAVDFAIGSNNDYPLELLKAGANVKAVAAFFQKDPQILMTHMGNGIETMEDIKGKPVLLSQGSIHTFWVWAKAKYGFEDSQVRKYTFNMAPFIQNTSTIQQGYITSEPFIVKKQAGIDVKTFLLADHGYATYASLILVPEKWIQEKPELVQNFVNASIDGWNDYLYGDPAPANALIKKDNPEMTDEIIAYGIKSMKENGIVDSGDTKTLGIGAMTDERIRSHFTTAVSQGRYGKDLPYKEAFTLEFVNKKYGM